ncbi:MAG: hypothetical protein KF681_04245 [Bdellovibrionaceae bacterium]|nr:hypothetical protein [Pseudobdellovibrionaceae bacterium]
MKNLILILALSSFSVGAFAKTSPQKATKGTVPAHVQAIGMRTVHGEKEVVIETVRQKDGTWKISMGKTRSRVISEADVATMIKEFKKLPKVERVPASCDRHQINLMLAEGKKTTARSSCFGPKTKNSDAYLRFSRLMVLAL